MERPAEATLFMLYTDKLRENQSATLIKIDHDTAPSIGKTNQFICKIRAVWKHVTIWNTPH